MRVRKIPLLDLRALFFMGFIGKLSYNKIYNTVLPSKRGSNIGKTGNFNDQKFDEVLWR